MNGQGLNTKMLKPATRYRRRPIDDRVGRLAALVNGRTDPDSGMKLIVIRMQPRQVDQLMSAATFFARSGERTVSSQVEKIVSDYMKTVYTKRRAGQMGVPTTGGIR